MEFERVKAGEIMVCQKCGIKNATIHFTNIINGNITEFHLCDTCAKDKDSIVQIGINELMSGFFGIKTQTNKKELKCDFCGSKQNEVSKRGKAGCEHCYEVFGEYIIPIVRQVHGTDTHIGKKPLNNAPNNTCFSSSQPDNTLQSEEVKAEGIKEISEIEKLESEMKQAISNENYERAAEIRDEIKKIKKKGDPTQ